MKSARTNIIFLLIVSTSGLDDPATVAQRTNTFNAANAAVNNARFPKLKLLAYFDEGNSALIPGAMPAYTNFAQSL
jgi:hypothetical protein